MTKKAEIQIQDQFGNWQFYKTVPQVGTEVQHALKSALKTQLASKSKKVRAVDKDSGAMIDVMQA
jgi:hypothetical protein